MNTIYKCDVCSMWKKRIRAFVCNCQSLFWFIYQSKSQKLFFSSFFFGLFLFVAFSLFVGGLLGDEFFCCSWFFSFCETKSRFFTCYLLYTTASMVLISLLFDDKFLLQGKFFERYPLNYHVFNTIHLNLQISLWVNIFPLKYAS